MGLLIPPKPKGLQYGVLRWLANIRTDLLVLPFHKKAKLYQFEN